MARILVGDLECTYKELTLLFDERSISTLKIDWWTSFAMLLDIREDSWKKWQQDLLLNKLTHINVIHNILTEWRMMKSNEATLGALYKAIPKDLKQFKNYLQAKIREKAKSWDDLDDDSQNVVLETKVKFLGRKYSLSSIKAMMTKDKFEEIINMPEMLDCFHKSFNNEDVDLGHYQIPKPLSYYIPRKLTFKRKLNKAIFKPKFQQQPQITDIFVFEGMMRHQLSILAKPNSTGVSSEQLKKVTSRFILLEHSDDYDEIIKITKEPVHKIKQIDDQLFWLGTSGSNQLIRMFLNEEQEILEETALVKDHLSTFNNRPIAIFSSPGMGKSVLLANLAQQMIKSYPNRIVVYLELRTLSPKLSIMEPEVSFENIKQILVSSLTISLIGKQILFKFLDRKDTAFEVFLDGFDELSLELLQPAKHFLKCLLRSPNMRVYITSRPHMKNEMENTLEVVSFDIAPFNQENQLKLFCDFWEVNQNIENREKLSQFARTVLQCLEFINPSMTSEFAGIPLQCFMLAQVYANQAKMYCNREHFNFQATISLYELYNNFTKFKFENIAECDRYLIKFHHWKEALTLLFPDNQHAVKILQEVFIKQGTKEIPWETIFSVGILEYSPDKPNFVHRTYAEYLVAEFIVEELLINEIVDISATVQFIIESVIYVNETTKGYILSDGEIEYIRDYIEASKSWITVQQNLETLKAVLLSESDWPLQAVTTDFFQILLNWLCKKGSNATIDLLDGALRFLGCNQLVDDLHKHVFQRHCVLQHEMICTFVEASLRENDKTIAAKIFKSSAHGNVSSTQNENQLILKLFTCTQNGYQYFTKILVRFYRGISIFNNILHMNNELCEELLLQASHHDNVEFFKYICDTVNPFMESNLNDFLKKFTFKDRTFKRTPLLVSIRRGNYNLVEYFLNLIEDDVKEISDLWIVCFFESWKNSSNMIINKVEILRRLKNLNQNFQVERLEQCFLKGVNLVMLTTLYDLCDYVPCEKDVKFMNKSVLYCCGNDDEFDNLVIWLLSKNLAHLLTYQSDFSLTKNAIIRNLMKPETLLMIYTENHFDLGIIFPFVVLCKRSEAIVNTIVNLSKDINLIDSSKKTLLHWTASYRQLNLIKYLLSNGAIVNSRDALGNTPLYNVFQNMNCSESFHSIHDIVCLLLTNKADVCAKNIAGLSVLQLAKVNQEDMSIEEKTIELLEKAVCQYNDVDTHLNCSREDLKIIHNTHLWFTLLYVSVKCKGFLTFVKNVVNISGNVSMPSRQNATLLHYAALAGEKEAMQYLLLKGANPNAKDNDGFTPLHLVFDWYWKNNYKILTRLNMDTQWIHSCVQLLLKYNADVNVMNNEGQTPLDLALEEKDHLNIEDRTISLLIEKSQSPNELGKWERLSLRMGVW